MHRATFALLAIALGGCYTYAAPPPGTDLAPGKEVRVRLTPDGGDSLARYLGPNVASVDGRLMVADDTGYELGVTEVVMHTGLEQYWKGEVVTLPKPYVAQIQQRTFSWLKSGVLAGAIVLTAVALGSSGKLGSGFGGGGGHPPQ